MLISPTNTLLRRVQHLACQPLGGEIHLFFRSTVDGNGAVLIQREVLRQFVNFLCAAVLHLVLGKLQPPASHAKRDLVGGNFNNSVLGCGEPMSGCVTAKQRRPGGPEFGVETVVNGRSPPALHRYFQLQPPHRQSTRLCTSLRAPADSQSRHCACAPGRA